MAVAVALVLGITGVAVAVHPSLTARQKNTLTASSSVSNGLIDIDRAMEDGALSVADHVVAPGSEQPASAGPTAEPVVRAIVDPDPPPPAESGSGRRVVFSQSDQRVWLIEDNGDVARTYLVSGSKHDNLDPGSYAVTARLPHAVAYDYSGTMDYFVQFTYGETAAIGFHTVPRFTNGELEQTKDQLGTPLSAGCVRQWVDDAKALWDFADYGTPVIVVA